MRFFSYAALNSISTIVISIPTAFNALFNKSDLSLTSFSSIKFLLVFSNSPSSGYTYCLTSSCFFFSSFGFECSPFSIGTSEYILPTSILSPSSICSSTLSFCFKKLYNPIFHPLHFPKSITYRCITISAKDPLPCSLIHGQVSQDQLLLFC